MKKKGFTLIELLAVIVILAIIALIATPTILGVIEKARKGAAKSSALGYIDAVEKQIMINELDTSNSSIKDGIYSFATISTATDTEGQLIPQNWSTIASGALTEKLDESDDAEAEAKYEKVSKELELTDKKLQMTMDELETKRDAVKTEMDSVEKGLTALLESKKVYDITKLRKKLC